MCGRFTLRKQNELLAYQLQMAEIPAVVPRYNIAPTQTVLAIRPGEHGREWALLRWGLVPSWAKSTKGPLNINARSETVATSPAFRSAFKRRRCLIAGDGFYEWVGPPKDKRARFFSLKDEKVFAFAGIWERWQQGETVIESCAVLTTTANELVKPVHDRMPVILTDGDYSLWLNGEAPPSELESLLRPLDAGSMTVRSVGSFVNSARNEGDQCVLDG